MNSKELKLNLTYLLAVLVFVLLASIVNPTWLYNPFGWVDQWAYFGQAYFYPRLVEHFPLHPAGDLLPVILPSALSYKLFSPIYANVIRDLLYLSVFLFALFLNIRRFSNATNALIVISLAGGYQYLLSAVGSDYTDGYVITYYALSLYFVARSRDATPAAQRYFLIISGGLFACMVYSAILSVTYLPTLFLYSVLSFRDHNISIWSTLTERSKKFVTSYLIGFIAATGFFSCIYWLHSDGFFFIHNIRKLLSFVGGAYSAPPLNSWLPDASWLIFPVGVVIASFVYLIKQFFKCRTVTTICYALEEKHVVAILVLASIAIMLFVNFVVKQWSLQFLYFDQTLPITFLGLGVILSHANETSNFRKSIIEIGSVVFASLLTLWVLNIYAITWKEVQQVVHLKPIFVLYIAMLATGVILSLALLNSALRRLAIIWILVLNVFSFSPSFGNFLSWDVFARSNMPKLLSSNKSIFITTIKLAEFVDMVDPDRSASLWYSEAGPFGPLIRQVNAVTYLNSADKRINKTFPNLNDFTGPIGSEGHPPQAGETLLILSLDENHLQQAAKSLMEVGLSIKCASTSQVKLDTSIIVYGSKVLLN